MCFIACAFCSLRQLCCSANYAVLADYQHTLYNKTLHSCFVPATSILFIFSPSTPTMSTATALQPYLYAFCSVLSPFSTAYLLQPIAPLCVPTAILNSTCRNQTHTHCNQLQPYLVNSADYNRTSIDLQYYLADQLSRFLAAL